MEATAQTPQAPKYTTVSSSKPKDHLQQETVGIDKVVGTFQPASLL